MLAHSSYLVTGQRSSLADAIRFVVAPRERTMFKSPAFIGVQRETLWTRHATPQQRVVGAHRTTQCRITRSALHADVSRDAAHANGGRIYLTWRERDREIERDDAGKSRAEKNEDRGVDSTGCWWGRGVCEFENGNRQTPRRHNRAWRALLFSGLTSSRTLLLLLSLLSGNVGVSRRCAVTLPPVTRWSTRHLAWHALPPGAEGGGAGDVRASQSAELQRGSSSSSLLGQLLAYVKLRRHLVVWH